MLILEDLKVNGCADAVQNGGKKVGNSNLDHFYKLVLTDKS